MWQKDLKQLKKQSLKVAIPAPKIQVSTVDLEVSFLDYCHQAEITPLYHDQIVLRPSTPKKPRLNQQATRQASYNYLAMFDEEEAKSEFYRFGQHNLPKELRQGKFAFNATIDLHNYTKAAAIEALAELLQHSRGCLKIIHGQGLNSQQNKPVLQGAIRKFLEYQPRVLGYSYGAVQQGGGGVTLVKLKGLG